jgi:hypothetical protein
MVEGLMLSISGPIMSLKRALQSWRWLWLATFVFLLCLSPSLAQDNSGKNTGDSRTIESPIVELNTGNGTSSVSRGTSVKVTGDFPEDIKSGNAIPKLKLFGEDRLQPIKGNSDKDGRFEFVIPEDSKLGEYSPRLLVIPKNMQDVQDAKPIKTIAVSVANSGKKNKLKIYGETGDLQPVIESISPSKVIFPYQSNSHPPQYHAYSFNVFGSGFSPTPSDNHLVLSAVSKDGQDNPTITPTPIREPIICWKNEANEFIDKTCDNKKNVIGKVLSNRQLAFKNFTFNKLSNDVNGELGIAIRVGDKKSDMTEKSIITLSRVPYQAPLMWALFGLLSVAAIIVAILSNSRKDGSRPSLNALIIDPDTNTYSLSRFQFVLWTLVAILSYLFLFFSKSLAQGKIEFIDIPDGLPGIVLASAATTFFAIGIDSTKGGKASGPDVDPVWSDLISAGGSVLPDRLQFFAWTIIGVFVYAFTTLFQNPGVISDLPAIPPGFLQLSGISAVGYLGGKLARKPGPLIVSIDTVTHDGFFLTLVLNGQNLSKDASLILTGKDNTKFRVPQIIGLSNGPEDDDKMKATIQIINAEPGDSALASRLMIKVPSEPAQWPLLKDHNYDISIINPDSQIAAFKFSGLTVEAAAKAAEDAKAAKDAKAAALDAAKAAENAKAAEDAAKTAADKATTHSKAAADAKAAPADAKAEAALAKLAADDAAKAAQNAKAEGNAAKATVSRAAADPKSAADAAKSAEDAAKSAESAAVAAKAAADAAKAAEDASK